ncbi:transglycosylase domain-containing protein [Paenibacillus xerothermodurans]|nr:PBP1A family penicillin-binding protein [Paenibacillus xerothermodurans]
MKKHAAAIILIISIALIVSGCSSQIPAINGADVTQVSIPVNSTIFDGKGNEVSKLFDKENREYVPLAGIPDYLVKAFVVTEDQRFYEHSGVDAKGIFRALYRDVTSQSLREGASTITQQVAKNAFLTQEKTIGRKLSEMAIAIELEQDYTKEQILEMYVNLIYFGEGVYGVKTAAQQYFGKDVKDVSISEAAMLAGLPKAPSAYSPRRDMTKAEERRNVVLNLMREHGVISAEQALKAEREQIKLAPGRRPANNEHRAYMDYVVKEASQLLQVDEASVRSGGYRIYTSFNSAVQRVVNESVSSHKFSDDRAGRGVEVGMAVLKPRTGSIVAVYGGRTYQARGFNRATAYFQPGSVLKPLAAYAPAIETKGWKPYDRITDAPTTFDGYTPKNYGERYFGNVTLYEALSRSLNVPAVYLLHDVGIEAGARIVQAAGIELDPKDKGLSLALGGMTRGASPLQLAQAYSAFANHGKVPNAHAIVEIQDRNGKTIYKTEAVQKQIMEPETADTISEMLQGVITEPFGTGRNAYFGKPAAGKTGTTQVPTLGTEANKDAWFVGYTSDFVTAIHVGFDQTDREHYLSNGGGREPAELFSTVMRQVYGN